MQFIGKLTFILLIHILIFGSVSTQTANYTFLPGVLLSRAGTTDIIFPNEPPCDGQRPVVCTGCRTIKICVGLPDPNNPTQLCPVDTPYCDSNTGSCSTVPDNSQADCSSIEPPGPQTSFLCSGKGFYPNPYSCLSYFYCEKENLLGDLYQCPPGYKYNSRARLCQRAAVQGRPISCEELSCSQTGVTFNAYPLDSKYYYYCQYDATDLTKPPRIVMIACDDGASFDQHQMRCVFRCPREGLFAKSTNRNRYFQCYRANRRLVYTELSCPVTGQVFDDVKKVCVTEPSSTGQRSMQGTGDDEEGDGNDTANE